MKACIITLLPTIVRIVNLSFTEACVREILKLSAVEPRIKNPMLDNELRSSYRPISNLRFISKAIEKVAADRLNCHLTENDLHVPLQSAYKPSHGTETALLKVQNVILRSLDKNNCHSFTTRYVSCIWYSQIQDLVTVLESKEKHWHGFRPISRTEVLLCVLRVGPRPVRIFITMGLPKDPHLVLSFIYYTLHLWVMSSNVMICRVICMPMTARYTCPFSLHVLVSLNTPNLRWKRVSLMSIVGW